MQSKNFYFAASKGVELIMHRNLQAVYQDLIDRLRAAHADPNSGQSPHINNAFQNLRTLLAAGVPQFTAGQAEAWRILGLDKFLGRAAVQRVNQVASRQIGSPAAQADELTAINAATGELAALCGAIAANSQQDPTFGEEEDGRAALRIRCAGLVDARTLDELKRRADEWDYILQTLAELAGASTASPEIRNVDRGSFIMDVVLNRPTWEALGVVLGTSLAGLKVINELRTMRKRSEALGLPAPPVDERAEEVKRETREQAVAALPATSDPELLARTGIAVDKVVFFLHNGGQLQYLPPPGEEPDKATATLGAALHQYYALRDGAGTGKEPRLPSDGSASS